MKTLRLPPDLRASIFNHCAQCYPGEACGLLIGGDDNMVTEVIPSANLSHHPRRNFDIDPQLIMCHQKKARDGGEKILGHYHSHPDGPAVPSLYDQDHNYDSDMVWVIIQVIDGAGRDIKAYFTDRQSGQLRAVDLVLA